MKVFLQAATAATVAAAVAGVTANNTWNIYPNQNAVYNTVANKTPGVIDGGKTDTWQDCQAVAEKASLSIFTWHDENQGQFAHDCWLRNDGQYAPTPQEGHVSGVFGPTPPSEAEFDCAMRKFAYEYGRELIPRAGGFDSLYWALNLSGTDTDKCQVPPPTHDTAPTSSSLFPTPAHLPVDAVFVNAASGADEGVGSVEDPLRSLEVGIARAMSTQSRTVVLRDEGVFYLSSQLVLTSQHSGLTITSYPGENAVVSGGKQLSVNWTSYDTTGTNNIWVADVAGQVDTVPGLQIDGARATRARYPNLPGGIEVSCGYGCMISGSDASWTPPDLNKFGPVTYYTDSNPEHDRNDTANEWFQHYMIGINGLCSVYDPPVSYWCSEHPSGGGAFAFRTPSGVTPNAGVLPNAPYKDVSQAILNVWRPARWANWMFEVDIAKSDISANNFTFGHGGFQGARGNDAGGDFFIENVFEELDYTGEFFHNETDGKLYLFYNGTGAPPASATVVAPQQQVLVNMSGTQWDPVKDVKLTGVTYTAAAYTYMNPHGVPSAGNCDGSARVHPSTTRRGTS